MLTNSGYTRRCSAHLRPLQDHRWLVFFAILILLLIARQDSAAQTVEAPGVVVTGEAIATPTPHDNFREMRQHILPEVQGTAITVTKKATVWQTDLYLGYRPDEHQLFALDFYSSRFDGGDPGPITYKQWVNDPNFSFTPFNNDWVDRYTTVLRYERDFGSGWLMQVKGWFTHQEIDARTAVNNVPGAPHPFPSSTT